MKNKLIFVSFFLIFISLSGFSQRVFFTGDSHVSGKVYPQEVKRILEDSIPSVEFSTWGKAGAGFYTFNDTPAFMDSIYNAQPEILVVHLGTNGCYNVAFKPEKCIADIETFYSNIRDRLPDCKIVFVTPFYNKNRKLITKKRKKRVYGPWKLNENTRACSDVILEFANTHPNTFAIDNNADAGTVFVDDSELIRSDYVHLTVKGYELLGRQVAERLLEIPELWQNSISDKTEEEE